MGEIKGLIGEKGDWMREGRGGRDRVHKLESIIRSEEYEVVITVCKNVFETAK